MDESTRDRTNAPGQCNFCHRTPAEVRKLIAGPDGVFICDMCVEAAHSLVKNVPSPEPREESGQGPLADPGRNQGRPGHLYHRPGNGQKKDRRGRL